MIIRPATAADLPALVAMTLHFIAQTGYQRLLGTATRESVSAFGEMILGLGDQGVMFLAEDEDGPFGMLILVAVPNPLSGEVFAEELCWWVEPHRRGALKAGPALLQHAEAWTRAKGITTLKMVAPANTEVGLFYARQGYHAVETAWAKTI